MRVVTGYLYLAITAVAFTFVAVVHFGTKVDALLPSVQHTTISNLSLCYRHRRCKTQPLLALHSSSSPSDDSYENDKDDRDDTTTTFNLASLQRRIDSINRAESQSRTFLSLDDDEEEEGNRDGRTAMLPALVFDALLPKQELVGVTSDPTFSKFLRDIGIGGYFVMLSLDPKQRKVRRDGTLCRIQAVDAGKIDDIRHPTAVDFKLSGLRHCRVIANSDEDNIDDSSNSNSNNNYCCDRARIGRWRRGYDPDGEETRLGWGYERLTTIPGSTNQQQGGTILALQDDDSKPTTEWSDVCIQFTGLEEDNIKMEEVGDDDLAVSVMELANRIPSLLEKWEALACNEETYQNTDVVAMTRVKKGLPMLRVKPATLLKNVKSQLGPIPNIDDNDARNLKEFVFWGAALINPLPPLGVSPEIRGRILAATSNRERLEILIWGIERSIMNLQGTKPL